MICIMSFMWMRVFHTLSQRHTAAYLLSCLETMIIMMKWKRLKCEPIELRESSYGTDDL